MSTQNIYDLTDTWNAAGTTFTAIKMNVTDTASAAGSLLMDLQVGGVSKFNVRKDGRVITGGALNPGGDLNFVSAAVLSWNSDTNLQRDAANTLAQRNGTNAQLFRIYSTFTDASNYERLAIGMTGSTYDIVTQNAGTGVARQLRFGNANTIRWVINDSGHFLAAADNTYDIGANGANRPRNVNVGAAVFANALSITSAAGANRSNIIAPSDGIIGIYNAANTDFNRLQFGGTTSSFPALKRSGAEMHVRLADDSAFAKLISAEITSTASLKAHVNTAIPAGGTAGAGVIFSSTSNFGMFFGSGAPTLSAAKGSLYLRSDGTTTNDRAYINTDGATTWTALTTAA